MFFEVCLLSRPRVMTAGTSNRFILGMSTVQNRAHIGKVQHKEHFCKRNLSGCSQWCLEQWRKLCKYSNILTWAPNLCTLQPSEPTWPPDSLSLLSMLTVFVFGVKSLQQSSQYVPWDLLVLVYQWLDRLLHLQSKKTLSAAQYLNDWCSHYSKHPVGHP